MVTARQSPRGSLQLFSSSASSRMNSFGNCPPLTLCSLARIYGSLQAPLILHIPIKVTPQVGSLTSAIIIRNEVSGANIG